jgi:hypothetical protein
MVALPLIWIPLANFQTNVAKRWQQRARSCGDVFAQFFFYFAGFNALYFLWAQVDDIRNEKGQYVGEEKQIHNLIKRLSPSVSKQILEDLKETLRFFMEHNPIQRMDRRNAQHPIDGQETEGAKWRRDLFMVDQGQRLLALGSILYQIRCNLVHGGKIESGDDKEIITRAVPAVALLLDKCLAITESWLKEVES